MSLFSTCTACGARQPLEAGLIGEDGKRLALIVADMPPGLARALLAYLGLFKPPKTELRMSTALKRAQELQALIAAGTVCRDERGGVRRSATADTWAAGIESMLLQRTSLNLPLDGHGYLRAVVFGLADKADAKVEQQRETDRKQGRHRSAQREDPITNALRYADRMVELGSWDAAQRNAYVAAAREKHAGGSS